MIDVRAGAQVADWGLPCLQPPPGSSFAAKPLRSVRATVVAVGGESEGKPWVAVGDSGGGMCVLDARMGLVLYRWKVNNEAGVSHAETVPGDPHTLLSAAERTLTGMPPSLLPWRSPLAHWAKGGDGFQERWQTST
jgi:hypothetical protein